MTQFNSHPFERSNDDGDSFQFDPTLPSYMKTNSGSEIPESDYCSFASGTRHPSLRDLRNLTQSPEPGSLVLPSSIPLLNDDRSQPLTRTPVYGVDLVLQTDDRAKHTMVFAPTGGGKNVTVLDMFRYSSLRDPTQTTVTYSLKASDYGPIEAICRAAGKKLVVVNLNDAWRSMGWNPLATKSADVAFDRIRRFADSVKNPTSNDSEFWTQWIKTALKGAWEAGFRSFPDIYRLFSATGPDLIEALRQHDNTCSSQLASFILGESHNAQTVLASIVGAMSCFLSDNVMRVMSRDELNLRELFRTPVCLHVEIPETSLETQLVLNQMFALAVTDELINVAEKYREAAPPSTIFYDDKPSLGCLLSPSRLMTMRSRRIGVVAGVQSLASLELVYGHATRALIDNFQTKIILPGGPADDAAFFATASGEQMVGLPAYEGHTPTFINRPLLSSAAIRTPSYSHPTFGMPATIMFGATTFQAYLQRSYEHPSLANILRSTRHVTGLERLRKRRLPAPKPVTKKEPTSRGFTITRGWSDERLRLKLDEVRAGLGWNNTAQDVRNWWLTFEQSNKTQLRFVLQVAEELAKRKASITEFYEAYRYSMTENIQANLHYMEFRRAAKDKSKPVSISKSLDTAASNQDPQAVLLLRATDGFEVKLNSFGSKKLDVIKMIKSLTLLSLMETKNLVESAPVSIGRARTRDAALQAIREINEQGGDAQLA